MSRYRICPHATLEWKVQRRFLWMWWDVTRNVGYQTYEVVAFDNESLAEVWIQERLNREQELAALRAEARRRRRHYVPRAYP